MKVKESSDWRHQIITSDDFDEAGDEISRQSQETGIGWDEVTTPEDYLPEQPESDDLQDEVGIENADGVKEEPADDFLPEISDFNVEPVTISTEETVTDFENSVLEAPPAVDLTEDTLDDDIIIDDIKEESEPVDKLLEEDIELNVELDDIDNINEADLSGELQIDSDEITLPPSDTSSPLEVSDELEQEEDIPVKMEDYAPSPGSNIEPETTDFFNEEEDDEGPIALSDDEFDSILEEADQITPVETITEEPLAPMEEDLSLDELDEATPAEQNLETPDETPEQISDTTNAEETTDFFKDNEDDGPIALSDDEFDSILEEADEVSPVETITEEPLAPMEEELSLDELDEATPAEQNLETSDETPEQISDTTNAEETTDFFKDNEDDGPIALSDDEFDSILEEADEVSPVETITEEPLAPMEEDLSLDELDEA
ncbi:MAG: hypothetical protein ABUK01_02155, partial [Leptospirales bacterium]